CSVTFHFSFISFDSELPTLVPVLVPGRSPVPVSTSLVTTLPLDDHSLVV
ncbi:hypothetical protein BS47DRAFT_1346931, partial [Hydnum rufescens UP504]